MKLVLGFVVCAVFTKTAWASPQLSRFPNDDGNQRGLSPTSGKLLMDQLLTVPS